MKQFFKKAVQWLKGAFTKNLGMKIGALVFAFLLWSFVIADQNPIRDKAFSDVMVNYVGTDTLRERGLTSSSPLSELLGYVNVTVEARSESLPLISKDMITARVDLSGITEPGTYTLAVSAASALGNVVKIDPAEVEISIEPIDTVDVPVEAELTGEMQNWLYYGTPRLSNTTIPVTGARSNVEQIARAVCYIDVTGLDAPNRENRTVTLLDAGGNVLEPNMFTNVPSEIVEVAIYPQKSVPIDLQSVMETTVGLAEGYEITGVVVEPEMVDVAGPLEAINSVSKVTLEPIVLEDASADQAIEGVKVVLPEGVYATSPAAVTVRLTIAQEQESKTYDAVDIGIKNLDSGLTATLNPESVDIAVTGTKAALDAFTAGQLAPFVDLQGLGKGVHTVPIKFQNQADLNVTLTPAVATVKVTIT